MKCRISIKLRNKINFVISSVIRVINKIGRPRSGSPICLITSMITDRIGGHEVLLPNSLHERGRDSCYLRAVLCYKRLFTKDCMGCKQFILKERKNVMFLNKIDVPYCLVVFFAVCPRVRPF